MKINYRDKKHPASTTVAILVLWYLSELIYNDAPLATQSINLKIISKDNITIVDWDTIFNFEEKFLKEIPQPPIVNELVASNTVDENLESLTKDIVIKIDKSYVEYMMA